MTLFTSNYIKPLLLLLMLGRIYSHADVTKSSSCFVLYMAHFIFLPTPSHSSLSSCVCLLVCVYGQKTRLSPNVDGTAMLIGCMLYIINPCMLWVTVKMTTDKYLIVGVKLYVQHPPMCSVASLFLRKISLTIGLIYFFPLIYPSFPSHSLPSRLLKRGSQLPYQQGLPFIIRCIHCSPFFSFIALTITQESW